MADEGSFKTWFKQRRKALDLTQEELAHLAGCSIYTVQRIEEGVLRPSRQLGELLAAGLEIAPAARPAFVRWARTGERSTELVVAGAAPTAQPAPAYAPSGNGFTAPPLASPLAGPEVEVNPYKGLRAFHEVDAPDFFGRETLTQQLLGRLAEDAALSRFLAVVGPSGSGKSSVVRAGLMPALRRQLLPGGRQPVVVDLIPGARPLEELEAALLRVAVNPPPSLLEQLRADQRGLARAVKRVLPGDDQTEMLLVIDQFEELFTLVRDEATRQDFIESLFSAITEPRGRLWVVITLRADFYDRPLLYLPSSELLGRRTEVVGPLTADEMYRAITGPAERAGLEFESSLVATILQAMGEQPGALPLLQYTLTELYERRTGRLLTLAAYRASGGIFGSLAKRAESLYAALTPAEQLEARQLFLRLMTLGEGVEDTRRRVRIAELVSAARNEEALHRVLDVFRQYRMLTLDRDPVTREPLVEVAHEALLRSWGRLHSWLTESRDQLLVQRRLMFSAAEWQAAGQERSFLANGARLARFAELAAEADASRALALTGEEQAYVAASLADQQRQQAAEQERQLRELALQKRAANRLRYLTATLALFLLVASTLALLAFAQQRAAQTNLTHSEALRLASEANGLLQSGGPAELVGLLSLLSIRTQHTPQGDAVLEAAARLDYPVRRFAGYTDTVAVLTFSPDGKRLLSSDNTSTIRQWDVPGGKELNRFPGRVSSLAYAPDGAHFATDYANNTVVIWDSATMTQTAVFSGHTGRVLRALYSPDGKYLLSTSADKTARIWDAGTGHQVRIFRAETDLSPVPDRATTAFSTALAWSPDGKYVVTGGNDGFVRLWDAQTGRLVRRFDTSLKGADFGVLAYSPDGKTIATPGPRFTIVLWDVATGARLRELVGHTNTPNSAAFSSDGKSLFTGSQDNTARLWDVATGQEQRVFRGPMSGAVLSPDGRYATAAAADGTVLLWDLAGHADPPILGGEVPAAPGRVWSASFSADDRTVLTSNDSEGKAQLWDATTGRPLQPLFFGANNSTVNYAAFSPDGKYVLLADGRPDAHAHLFDITTGTEVRSFLNPSGILFEAVFSPDGRQVLTAGFDSRYLARLWDTATARPVLTFTGHTSWLLSTAYAPDGQTVLTGSADGTARLWDVRTGQERQRFTANAGGIVAVAYTPDGKRVLTADDNGARLWDLQTGASLGIFANHQGEVKALAVAPDGNSVLSGNEDGVAYLWDIRGAPDAPNWGGELRRFTGHAAGVVSVAFSHDGKYLLTGSSDGTARIWHTDYHDTVRYLCGRLARDLTPAERAQYNIASPAPTCP